MKARILAAAALLTPFAVACSAGSSGATSGLDASAPPAAGGFPSVPVDQLFYGTAGSYQFKLTDYAMGCALQQQSNTNKKNSQYWKIAMSTPPSGMIPPGTYSLNTASNGVMLLALGVHRRDATCTEIDNNATVGSITITSATTTAIEGTVNAELPGVGSVSVKLSATFCDTTASTGAKACIP